jgi:DNA-binding IclR family transcriptional regulator
MDDSRNERILEHMRRAPAGQHTVVQLARNPGISLPEVQQRLARLQRNGFVVRSNRSVDPAFQLTEPGLASPSVN